LAKSRRATLEEAEVYTRAFAEAMTQTLPDGWHFTLVLATPLDPMMTYVSNLERSGSVKMLRELTEKIDSGEPTL
jgi:hypothetical protein